MARTLSLLLCLLPALPGVAAPPPAAQAEAATRSPAEIARACTALRASDPEGLPVMDEWPGWDPRISIGCGKQSPHAFLSGRATEALDACRRELGEAYRQARERVEKTPVYVPAAKLLELPEASSAGLRCFLRGVVERSLPSHQQQPFLDRIDESKDEAELAALATEIAGSAASPNILSRSPQLADNNASLRYAAAASSEKQRTRSRGELAKHMADCQIVLARTALRAVRQSFQDSISELRAGIVFEEQALYCRARRLTDAIELIESAPEEATLADRAKTRSVVGGPSAAVRLRAGKLKTANRKQDQLLAGYVEFEKELDTFQIPLFETPQSRLRGKPTTKLKGASLENLERAERSYAELDTFMGEIPARLVQAQASCDLDALRELMELVKAPEPHVCTWPAYGPVDRELELATLRERIRRSVRAIDYARDVIVPSWEDARARTHLCDFDGALNVMERERARFEKRFGMKTSSALARGCLDDWPLEDFRERIDACRGAHDALREILEAAHAEVKSNLEVCDADAAGEILDALDAGIAELEAGDCPLYLEACPELSPYYDPGLRDIQENLLSAIDEMESALKEIGAYAREQRILAEGRTTERCTALGKLDSLAERLEEVRTPAVCTATPAGRLGEKLREASDLAAAVRSEEERLRGTIDADFAAGETAARSALASCDLKRFNRRIGELRTLAPLLCGSPDPEPKLWALESERRTRCELDSGNGGP